MIWNFILSELFAFHDVIPIIIKICKTLTETTTYWKHSTLHFAKKRCFIAPQIGYTYLSFLSSVMIIYHDQVIVVLYRIGKKIRYRPSQDLNMIEMRLEWDWIIPDGENYCFHWVHFYKFLSQTSSFQKYVLYVWWVSWLDVPLVSPLTHLDYEIGTPGLFTSWCSGLKWKTFTHGLFGSQHWILITGQLPTLNRLCLHLSFWLFSMFWPAISSQPCCLFTQIKLKIPLFLFYWID